MICDLRRNDKSEIKFDIGVNLAGAGSQLATFEDFERPELASKPDMPFMFSR